MGRSSRRSLVLAMLMLAVAACTSARPQPPAPPSPEPPRSDRPEPLPRAELPPHAPKAPKEPEVFESQDFVVTIAKAGDTPESLAARHLGDPRKKWMIEDYGGTPTFSEGQEVVIPKREWNPVGVYPWGYQLVPVLVYHDIGTEQKGKLKIAARNFQAQMRLLHDEGFQAVSLADFLAFAAGRRQLPRKSVLLTFDDGYRSSMQYARPVLKDYGFSATLFVYPDFIGGGDALSWPDLRELTEQGFDVQAHSKTHEYPGLRRKEKESQAAYAKRMESELAYPLPLFRKYLGRASNTLAYPFGDTDEELEQLVAKHGYVNAFTVRGHSNPAFVSPFRISRSQIYAETTLKDFPSKLTVFADQKELGPLTPAPAAASAAPWSRDRLAALHTERSERLEQRGRLRQALEERVIALTIAPNDRKGEEARRRLEARIETETTGLLQEGRTLLGRGLLGEAKQRFLAVLSLDPTNRTAFETLQNEVEVSFITHTVQPGDTCASLAEVYYGDRLRCEVIADTNRLAPNAPLKPKKELRIPEIPGIPFQIR